MSTAALEPVELDVGRWEADGFLVLPGFYDLAGDIDPIRRGIHDIIGLVALEGGIELDRRPYSAESFDDGYLHLRALDLSMAAAVYDAVKQLAPFVRLVGSARNEAVFTALRSTGVVGVAGGGSGIRIDTPDDDRYAAWWHQEYPAQLRSRDGVVFWSPLRSLTPSLGPVELLTGSHAEGVLEVEKSDGGVGRTGAYAMRLAQEGAVVDRHRRAAPLAQAGDLVLIDFLTVHRSGRNQSDVARWTMQLRYFNFEEATGRSLGWIGARR